MVKINLSFQAHCLEELEVKATPLNEQVMIVFCKALKVGSKLSSLTLSRCGLSGRFLIILTEALKLVYESEVEQFKNLRKLDWFVDKIKTNC